MRNINSDTIAKAVEKLCIDSNYYLNKDVYDSLKNATKTEVSPLGREILTELLDNAETAAENKMAICQDTGITVVFAELGQDLHIDGNLTEAINEGIKNGYEHGYLRKSIVSDPLRRQNTNDNTPGVIHFELVPGDTLKIIVAPKGFGSENCGAVKMLKPSDGRDGVIDFAVSHISNVAANSCPPIVVGIGLGGTMEKAAILAKKALLREVGENNPDPFYKELETCILEKINALGIGPAGFGGRTTALAVNIEPFPTHIAGLPMAINTCCHVLRHKEIIL
ncbi:MAG: fumarate hydratase [Clostridiales bacterium]|nr:fumarate hydratase [Clostridiales bacterium]